MSAPVSETDQLARFLQWSLDDHLRRTAERHPDRLFCSFEGRSVTVTEIDEGSRRAASRLQADGLVPGDRCALMMANSVEWILLAFGALRGGIDVVPVGTSLVGKSLEYILADSAAKLVIADPGFRDRLEVAAAADGTVRPRVCLDPKAFVDGQFASAEATPDTSRQGRLISYTSGTTGAPKSVPVTQRMLLAAGYGVTSVASVSDGDRLFVWEPFFHIGGSQALVIPLLLDVPLLMVPRFSASRFWSQVRDSDATHIHYLGGVLQLLLKQPVTAAERDHKVRVAWGGGSTAGIWSDIRARFGVQIHESYGMTECSSVVCANRNDVPGSNGRALPWFAIRIIDEASNEVPRGQLGEIEVRPLLPGLVFSGYLNNPDATARALRGGALRTSDLGYMDDEGRLFFQGRMTDSIRRRGENISAWEVERVINEHPAVAETAAIGVHAEIGEQEILLFVRLNQGVPASFEEIATWCATRMPAFQIPRYFVQVAEFPKTPSERIMKHQLPRSLESAWDRSAAKD